MTSDDLDDYRHDGEHTHAQAVPFIVWALLICVVVLAVSIAGLYVYLTGRAALADHRNAVTEGQTLALRRAVCTVLDPIRPGQVHGVDKARALPFPDPRGMEPLCVKRPAAKAAVKPTPAPTRSRSLVAPTRPAPATVTVIARPASTRPTPRTTATPPPSPQPAPSPSPTCITVICLP